MPRFLDTSTGEFRWIADASTVTYAILSHTWRPEEDGGEQTFDEINKLWKHVRKARAQFKGGPPSEVLGAMMPNAEPVFSHPDLCDKIKGICKVAREAGYKLIWIDSACIDKSSSAELAEAINSMFDLYRLADVCYVYLSDVHVDDPLRYGSDFERSRWHKRGWTLQELLAPKRVVFLTSSWTLLGTKISLLSALVRATGIDADILYGSAPLSSASVARRMSWASSRETTRIEDEAYSLLGIFGVHLSPIYGEGSNAFLRLQEEILKTIPDQSIFAWGPPPCMLWSLDNAELPYSDLPEFDAPTGLLAPSAREFRLAGGIDPLTPLQYSSFFRILAGWTPEVPPLHCVVTPQGVRLRLPCINLAQLPEVTEAINGTSTYFRHYRENDHHRCLSLGSAHSLAILRCTLRGAGILALALFPPSPGPDEEKGLPIATHMRCGRGDCLRRPLSRVVYISGPAIAAMGGRLSPMTSELFLLHHTASSTPGFDRRHMAHSTPATEIRPNDHRYLSECGTVPLVPIDLAPSCQEELLALGYTVHPLKCERSDSNMELVAQTTLCSSVLYMESSPALGRRTAFKQLIQITVTLTPSVGDPTQRDVFPSPQHSHCTGGICAQISISNFIHSHVAVTQAFLRTEAPLCSYCNPQHCQVQEYPLVDISGGRCSLAIPPAVRLPERLLAQTDFVVPFSLEQSPIGGPRRVRILRLAVERPLDQPQATSLTINSPQIMPSISRLWLAITLSNDFVPPAFFSSQLQARALRNAMYTPLTS